MRALWQKMLFAAVLGITPIVLVGCGDGYDKGGTTTSGKTGGTGTSGSETGGGAGTGQGSGSGQGQNMGKTGGGG